jgi:uncharacterized membrane protein
MSEVIGIVDNVLKCMDMLTTSPHLKSSYYTETDNNNEGNKVQTAYSLLILYRFK